IVSPTGFIYELGTPPVTTRFSQTAALYITKDFLARALERALLGVDSDPENPIHYMLAGFAHVRLAQYDEADAMFTAAERIYPAYELDIAPEREAAWIELFNAGIEAHARGDLEGTIEAWEGAERMWDLRPDASLNLAGLFEGEGRWDDAIEAYRGAIASLERRPVTRVLPQEELQAREDLRIRSEKSLTRLLLFTERFAEAEPLLRRHLEADPTSVQVRGDLAAALQGSGKLTEAMVIYTGLLSEIDLEARDVFNIGIALYRGGDFEAAAEAFERLTRLQPNSRDAWFNYTNSLFAAESWESLARAGDRLTEVDPLGENAGLIAARAHLELGDEESAAKGLDRTESAPIHVEGLQLLASGTGTSLRGRVVGNAAEPGTSVRLRFTFYGADGTLGTEPLTVSAPSRGVRAGFEISFAGQATAYRYELVSPPIP
ncbi:MAG: tetratricopeptide repeat protein, partial [Gemmatimonadetes bacterium]|nr:tetratricopeptide repeat protein [Gemmatimonadota bacterium]